MNWEQIYIEVYNEQLNFQLEKNKEYGNFYLSPIGIFSKDQPKTRVLNRLDEKLGRVKQLGLDKELARDIVGCLMSWLALDYMEETNSPI